ncbi:MAG TPA: phosphoglucosamine mutase [Candidatus Acidoferrum sp.]|nr:phosphoglucosamine mutase [Candidatus Acidoferrum sp.]
MMFGSSGIRGIANERITPELALNVGLAVGSLHKSAVIGHDPRTASEMIEHAIISGLISCGCDVTRVGLVSTPTLSYAARNCECGVMITASHNTSEYVGIKLWNKDGTSFNTTQQREVESLIGQDDGCSSYSGERANWNKIANVSVNDRAISDHMSKVLNEVGPSKLKVVVDCGSGSGSTITPYLLREMGCKVITLNAQPDGFFPARHPEPTEQNLELLIEAVRAFDADLGIAHDGDADRMMAVDRGGRYISGDEMLALFGLKEAKKSIVYPIDVSLMVDDVIHSEIFKTRIGDVYVAEEIKRVDADFGGESSGSWIFPRVSYCPDGIYAAARIVSIAEKEVLSDIFSTFPTYNIKRGSVLYDEHTNVMDPIEKELKSLDFNKITTIDGIRLDFDDGWILIRSSGTEPKIRITAEARGDEQAEKLYEKALNIIKRCVQC